MGNELGFSISPRTIRMIGRQNVSSQFVAINELIKNSFDADSPSCILVFRGEISKGEGTIEIIDNGSGMDLQTIKSKWLTIGTDNKEREPISPKGRIRTGAKGIGRFALDRLGSRGILQTFNSTEEDGIELIIDWTKYDSTESSFEDIKHEFTYIPNINGITGTHIKIENLHDRWSEEDMKELYEDLSFLIPHPKNAPAEFFIEIRTDEYPEVNGYVEATRFDAPEFEITTEVFGGKIRHAITHKSDYKDIKEVEWESINPKPNLFDDTPKCGDCTINLKFYLSQENSRSQSIKDSAFKKYLKTARGIRIYRDGFLVKPYGINNDDWLKLNPRKMRHNEGVLQARLGDYRIANHQLIGKVEISRVGNPDLQDKTNREGLIENQAFKDLKLIIVSAIRTLEYERQVYEKNMKTSFQKEQKESDPDAKDSEISEKRQLEDLEKRLASISRENSDTKKDLDSKESRNRDSTDPQIEPVNNFNNTTNSTQKKEHEVAKEAVEIAKRLLTENHMLRSLASVGISAITLSHEIKSDLVLIKNGTHLVFTLANRNPPKIDKLNSEIETIKLSTVRLNEWSELILERVQTQKRKLGSYDLVAEVRDIVEHYASTIERGAIQFEVISEGDCREVEYIPLDMESIILNLFSNSVKAIKRSSSATKKIIVTLSFADMEHIILKVADSGTGIRHQGNLLQPKECSLIFQPMVSYDAIEGTGMGLSIVKNICDSNNWKVEVLPENEMKGATFIITI